MHRSSRIVGALVAIALVAALAAPAHGASLSPEKYRAKVTALCNAAKAQAEALPEPKVGTDLAPYFEKTMKVASGMLTKVKAIAPPANLKAKMAKVQSAGAALNASVKSMVAAMTKAPDPETVFSTESETIKPLDEALSAAFVAAGLPDCA